MRRVVFIEEPIGDVPHACVDPPRDASVLLSPSRTHRRVQRVADPGSAGLLLCPEGDREVVAWHRAAQPVEIAPLFMFRASREARSVTGEGYGATGGQTALLIRSGTVACRPV